MSTFYIDSDNGNDVANDGSSPTKTNGDGPFATLHKFTETTRNAGDIAILRRGMTARYDDGGDLEFTSDGTIDNPIIIEADYGNAFGDDVDLSATATATLVFGSKTITFSADVSGVIAVGDWIYVAAEDAKEFAYEVAVVSTDTITLFLPYKGGQAGSGKTMTNMQDPPIWNTIIGQFEVNFDNDHFWKVQGLHLRGDDGNGIIELDSAGGHIFKDCIFEGLDGGSTSIQCTDDNAFSQIYKCRFLDYGRALRSAGGSGSHTSFIKDCLFDGDNATGSEAISITEWNLFESQESEFKNHSDGDIKATTASLIQQTGFVKGRNLIFSSTTKVEVHHTANFDEYVFEDYGGIVGDTRQLTGFSTAEATPILQSETSTVRSGGATVAIKFTPSTNVSTKWEFSRIKLFELPIYATTDSKKYEIFFRPTATADWTADPTNTELWIELEYWGHASNNFRRILKSTETIDMNGSITFTALSVTVAPAQAGVAYLRAYYAKTKESAKANTFFVDPIPVIT